MHISTRKLTATHSSDGRRPSAHRNRRGGRRDGIVLLVVIAMLALFAMVGLSFVYYSESVALAARYYRASVTSELRDIPPERILSQVLSQILYDTDDTTSKFSGLGLGRNMYGGPGGRFAFSGTGYDANASFTTVASQPEFKLGKGNAPYTYPDYNNPYLGAIDGDGNVIFGSYVRGGTSAVPITARAAGLPALPNPWERDVKNLMGSNCVKLPDGITVTITNTTKQLKIYVDGTMIDVSTGAPPSPAIPDGTSITLPDGTSAVRMYNGTTTLNDSYWMDPNITGQTKEGINYKVLVAPFIMDLDGRVNLATAGNWTSTAGVSSRGGIGPWEINPMRLADPNDGTAPLSGFLNLLTTNNALPTRFHDASARPNTPLPVVAASSWFDYDTAACPNYSYYAAAGNEPNYSYGNPIFNLAMFPVFPGQWAGPVNGKHPAMFDYHNAGKALNIDPVSGLIVDRRLAVSNTDAILRYGEAGSAGVTCDMVRSMTSFNPTANPTHRALLNKLTAFNMAVDVPHLPWFLPSTGNYNFTPPANVQNAAPLTAPQATQFSTTNADQMLLNIMLNPNGLAARYNLTQPMTVPNQIQIATNPNAPATKIFAVLRNMTGLTSDPTTWQYAGTTYKDANGNAVDVQTYRYLAQLAVNMVDYMDSDNVNTMFNWTGQQKDKDIDYVFGVEQPRILLNEAYASYDNDGGDMGLTPQAGQKKQANWYRLNIFFELLNPTLGTNINLSTSKYRVVVAKDTAGLDTGTPLSAIGMPTNIMTDDQGNKVIISNWNPANLGPNARSFSGAGFMLVGPPVYPIITPAPKGGQQADTFLEPPPMGNMPSSLPKRRPASTTSTQMIPDYMDPLLSIKVLPAGGDNTKGPTMIQPTLVLQRLFDPTRQPSNPSDDANSQDFKTPATYNPWITVDYFENISYNSGSNNTSSLVTVGQNDVTPDSLNSFSSFGRKHPFKATSVVPQNPLPVLSDGVTPKQTFRRHNGQNSADTSVTITQPFDWFVHLDRPLVNRGELMSISTTSPVLLTHKNGTPGWTLGEAMANPNTLLARLMESSFVPSFEYSAPLNNSLPPGNVQAQPLVRVPGKININTVFHKRILDALLDPQTDSNFTAADVEQFYTLLDLYRKGNYPGNTVPTVDPANPPQANTPRSGPIAGFSDFSYAGGTIKPRVGLLGILDQKPVKWNNQLPYYYGLTKDTQSAGGGTDKAKPPFVRDEAIRKIANNISFTSNTFAVWLTVGFFEVKSDGTLAELFTEDNRQIRHRMFAVIDRSQLVMPDSSQDLGVMTSNPQPGTTPTSFKVDVVSTGSVPPTPANAPTLSGRVGGNFSAPVGALSMDWKFVVGGTVQIGAPGATQVGQIIAVTPVSSTSAAATIEVAFPSINGQPPQMPAANLPIRFPDPIARIPTPFREFGVTAQPAVPPVATDLKSVQYGYPGPQPRFNVSENQLVVPYYTIID